STAPAKASPTTCVSRVVSPQSNAITSLPLSRATAVSVTSKVTLRYHLYEHHPARKVNTFRSWTAVLYPASKASMGVAGNGLNLVNGVDAPSGTPGLRFHGPTRLPLPSMPYATS